MQEPKTERLRAAYVNACKATDTNPKTLEGEGGGEEAKAAAAVADDDESVEKEVLEEGDR